MPCLKRIETHSHRYWKQSHQGIAIKTCLKRIERGDSAFFKKDLPIKVW